MEAIFENASEELLVRREITAQGRSRAFVNGALATATTLRDLSARLIELHGQHEHQTLLDPSTHLDLVDAFGALQSAVEQTGNAFTRWESVRAELARLRKAAADRQNRQDMIEFQLAELDRAGLHAPSEDVD